ncbi:MAG: GAF domain-containing protein [Anaerolineales bacterium]|nr:GAF domain-containing protein [Anaerolineales bacterium]
MGSKKQRLSDCLRYASQHSTLEWGAYLRRKGSNWVIDNTFGLKGTQKTTLNDFVAISANSTWLTKALSKQSSYRTLKAADSELGVQRVYAIPTQAGDEILLIGAGVLRKTDLSFLHSLIDHPDDGFFSSTLGDYPPKLNIPPAGSSLDLAASLQVILATVRKALSADLGLLAIRAGDDFTIRAVDHAPDQFLSRSFFVDEITPLAQKLQSQTAFALSADLIPEELGSFPAADLLGIPMVIGLRLIGFLILGRKKPFNPADLEAATAIGSHVAPSVEKSILGDEAAYYLQRFALLNELASFGGAGLDLCQVIERGEVMIQRAFDATRAGITLYDEEGKRILLSDETAMGIEEGHLRLERNVLEIGQVLRIDNLHPNHQPKSPGSTAISIMLAPMKFRGQLVGVLTLESDRPAAFSEQDEKYISVLTSQLASIILNTRLNAEMRDRAGAMQAVNEIVQEILGLSDLSLIASRTAQLMAEKFNHGMVLVMILDPELDELVAEGVAGVEIADMPHGFRFSRSLGIPGEVISFGNSVLLHDVRQSSDYVPIPGWEPGSGMWVPLRSGNHIFGVLSVEYQRKGCVDETDLAVLEAIAGILSSVFTNVHQTVQLQQSVRQLEAVRETALDIGTDIELETLLKRVVNRVRTLIDAHGAELGLVNQEEEVIEVLVSENPWQEYSGYRFKFNDGVTGRVAARGEPLAIADFNSWRGRQENAFKAPFTTVAGVPLKLKGEVIGTLVVQDDRPAREFTHNDIRTLELLAPLLAIFIRNARLYQELELRMQAQRLAEERLVRSAKLAAVGEMAAAVAHELNNPLTTVTGFAELLLDSFPEDSPEHEDMNLVLREAQRSRTVVRRLLDFSRQSDFLRVETDLNEIITTVMQMIQHLASTENITVRMELWGDIPLIRADRNQMHQVILNLVHNAIQAMPEGGELFIQSLIEKREEDDWLGIRIEDTGIGIEEEHMDKIFEPFFTTKPSGEGTGLGLSVSYSIVSEHGGYIDVVSTKGEGATFTIWLPIQRDEREG